jgi:hypothetical protein
VKGLLVRMTFRNPSLADKETPRTNWMQRLVLFIVFLTCALSFILVGVQLFRYGRRLPAKEDITAQVPCFL